MEEQPVMKIARRRLQARRNAATEREAAAEAAAFTAAAAAATAAGGREKGVGGEGKNGHGGKVCDMCEILTTEMLFVVAVVFSEGLDGRWVWCVLERCAYQISTDCFVGVAVVVVAVHIGRNICI